MDVSIDMKKLADSLSGKLECSIYRVAEPRRCSNPSHYTPQMVSIGPFHHGKEELQPMEEHKRRYLKCFLQRTEVCMTRFLTLIKDKEAELRDCYAETIHNLGSDEFVTMVLVDAVFLIQTDDDRIFGKPELHWDIRHDLWLVENQLPLFILIDLFNLAKTKTCGDGFLKNMSFITISCALIGKYRGARLPIPKNLLEIHFPNAKHFLDLIVLCLQPADTKPRAGTELKDPNIPSLKELHQAGVKFKPAAGSTRNLLDINFNQGILEIPYLTLYGSTERLYRNLIAFESMHGYTGYFNDYIIMMGDLVKTPKDAELLIRNKIFGLGNTEALATTFRKLDKDCAIDNFHFQYSGIVADLQDYSKLRWHKWRATLKQNYFNTPWASISVIAAVILLLLTATQTVSSLIAL
ncbi:hypothetical protein CICLE_v10015439mg [Citrus x clementina]|uniref:Uncharacterized protein n=1 Tax=Citrus clementina TaxID=85681 RepID=V4UA84_CITCL|nr:hypothetical protein CICLE_v10015439mg [Citrus x clementina]